MAVYKEINRADGSGVTTFYRISDILDTAETDDQEGQAVIIDYNQAQNKPSINGVALVGNKTSEDLGLQPAGDYITNDEADEKFIDEDELEAKNYVNQAELQDAIAHIEHFHREIVEALPVTGMDNVLYMVRKGGTGEDIYNEYIWVGLSSSEDGYEFLGTTATDLTDYYKKSQVDAALATKVDKEGGKGLSEQNYTLAEKTKLAGLENYDDSELQAEVAGLSNNVSSISTSTVTLNNRVATIEPKVETNSAAVMTIYDLLDKKMTAIRLVEQGDGWVWMNLEGSRLTYAQASAALGHENCMLFIEQLENDGKVIPAEYKSEGDHINVIFKDLDSLVHIMTCGEDDAVVTETVTTVHGATGFTVEDEAVGYSVALDGLYGDTYQPTYSGKNLWGLPVQSSTINGVTISVNSLGVVTMNGTVTATKTQAFVPIATTTLKGDYTLNAIYMSGSRDGQGNINLRLASNEELISGTQTSLNTQNTFRSFNIADDTTVVFGFYLYQGAVYTNYKFLPQLVTGSTADYVYEPYVGGIYSPNGYYKQSVYTVKNTQKITVTRKNILPISIRSSLDGLTNVLNSDGTITTTGLPTRSYVPVTVSYDLDAVLANGETYTISQTSASDLVYLQVNIQERSTGRMTYLYLNNAASKTFVADLKNYHYTATVQSGGTNAWSGTSHEITQYYKIERGNTATSFYPYEGQTFELSLGNIELCKIGNYQDKIYKQGDTWYLHKEIGKAIDQGTSWIASGAVVHEGQKAYRANTSYGFKRNTAGYCNSFNIITNGWARTNPDWTGYYELSENVGYFYVKVPEAIAPDLATWKTWAGNNNIIMYGILDTPVDTEIEDPTLLAQLEQLQQMTEYKYTDIVITSGNMVCPEADFTYIDNVVINNTDLVLGKDTYWNDEVPTSADLPANAQEGEIRIVQDTEAVYIYDGTDWIPFDKGTEVDLSNYLAKDNTTAWIPTGAFNPATKKYVDDSVGGIHVPTKTSQLQNDSNFINKNANDLTNYYLKTNTYTKAEVDALIQGGGGGIELVDNLNQTTAGKALDARQGNILSTRTVPSGGTTGQFLQKSSATDYDTTWTTLVGLPGGGTSGQVLIKNSATNYDAVWGSITIPNASNSTVGGIKYRYDNGTLYITTDGSTP